jgi:hypothetical protein
LGKFKVQAGTGHFDFGDAVQAATQSTSLISHEPSGQARVRDPVRLLAEVECGQALVTGERGAKPERQGEGFEEVLLTKIDADCKTNLQIFSRLSPGPITGPRVWCCPFCPLLSGK